MSKFGCDQLSAGSLSSAARRYPETAVMFYATDDNTLSNQVEQFIIDSGFAPLHIDSIDQSIRLEVFGELHEFGALGKPV